MSYNFRLHIPAMPHTIIHEDYSHCAFTGKVLRFGPMMTSRNFEVYHYGIETSEPNATENITLMTKSEWEDLRVVSYMQLHPGLTRDDVLELLANEKGFVGDLGNVGTPLYSEFNKRFREHLQKHYRGMATDIVCMPFGRAHAEAVRGLPVVEVETGIGYPDSYANYRIFESHAHLHHTCGLEKIYQPNNYWFVVPNYYDLLAWPFREQVEKPRIGYFGRICHVKGLDVFVEVAKRFPHVEFVICGQGDGSVYVNQCSNIIYQTPLRGKERGEFLCSLSALIAPSLYIEPFCGVNVEAQLCGVPVLCPDCGAFAETVEQFETGLRCHTLADYCVGVELALHGKFNRRYIRKQGVKKYDMYKVAIQYEQVFRTILDVSNGNNGWYSPESYLI